MRLALALLSAGVLFVAARPATAQRDVAAFDPSGYWVAVVTEDWKFRMVTPAKGVYDGVPLNAAGRQLADTWDPGAAQDPDCRNYGAASLLRMPGRLRIDWADTQTLRIVSDAGNQTRLLRFGPEPESATSASRQGSSVAEWQYAPGQSSRDGASLAGDLKVVTTRLEPGFLRPNGVPQGAAALVTEYFNVHRAPNGDDWLVVTIVVADPQYLSRPYVTSAHFKRVASDAGWHPTPCVEP